MFQNENIMYCMKGGKKISEGGFGCVYYPEINCKGETIPNTKFISKIQKQDINSDIEFSNGKIIKKIKDYELFYAPVIEQCPIELSKLKEGDIIQCEIFKTKGIDKKYILQKINYIKGQSFFDVFFKEKSYHNEKQNALLTLYETFPYLLLAIQKLYSNGFIHYDIKKENIMFDEERNIPIIIDFGLSFHFPTHIFKSPTPIPIKSVNNSNNSNNSIIDIQINNINFNNLSKFFYIYAPSYYLWCPEIHYICYLLHKNKNPNKNQIINVVNNIIQKSYLNKIFSPEFIELYKKFLSSFLLKFENKDYKIVITELLSYYNKWDNFSLCFMYLRIIYNILKESTIKFIDYLKQKKDSIIVDFIILLFDGLHPNPQIRASTYELINEFENLFVKYNKTGKEYELIYNIINKNKEQIYKSLHIEEQNLSNMEIENSKKRN